MDDEISLQDIIALAQGKIDLGYRLMQDLGAIDQVEGVKKVVRKIKQEITTLKNVSVTIRSNCISPKSSLCLRSRKWTTSPSESTTSPAPT